MGLFGRNASASDRRSNLYKFPNSQWVGLVTALRRPIGDDATIRRRARPPGSRVEHNQWNSPLFPDPQWVGLVTALQCRCGDVAAISSQVCPPESSAVRTRENSPGFPDLHWVRLVTGARQRRSPASTGIGTLNSVRSARCPNGFHLGKTPFVIVGLDRIRRAGRRVRVLDSAGLTRWATIVITPEQGLRVVGVVFLGGRSGDVADHPSSTIERPRRRDPWAAWRICRSPTTSQHSVP